MPFMAGIPKVWWVEEASMYVAKRSLLVNDKLLLFAAAHTGAGFPFRSYLRTDQRSVSRALRFLDFAFFAYCSSNV
jgi:hypothetical protein